MTDIHKKLESITNVAIIVVAVLFGTTMASKYFAVGPEIVKPQPQTIAPNTKFNLKEADWSTTDRTLVLAFSTTCRFCIESAGFYKNLAAKVATRHDLKMMVVSPQPLDDVKKFFSEREIQINDFVHAKLSDISVNGTPTLVLVDRDGLVKESWVGRLPPDGEKELLSKLFDEQGGS